MRSWTRKRRWPLVEVVVVVVAVGHDAAGQEQVAKDPAKGAVTARSNPLVERWQREAAEYRVVLQTSTETVPSLRPVLALDSTNPMRFDDGVSLLWVADGRPQVFACFFRYEGRVKEAHEFHSLATVPMVTSLGGRALWHPKGEGIRPKPIAGSPPAGHDGCGAASTDARAGPRIQSVGRPGKGGHRASAAFAAALSLRIEVGWRVVRFRHGDRSGSAIL